MIWVSTIQLSMIRVSTIWLSMIQLSMIQLYFNNNVVAHSIQATCSLTHCLYWWTVLGVYPKVIWRSNITWRVERTCWEWNQWCYDSHDTELPKGKKEVTSRRNFTINYLANGIVASGFTQTYGENYHDTFALVDKLHTIRIVFSSAVNLEWDLWQMNVKNAFLQGELDDEVYINHLQVWNILSNQKICFDWRK